MELGAFSVSLAVKNIGASKAFYEKLGFTVFAWEISRRDWLMPEEAQRSHGSASLRGSPERTTLTFNPGWDSSAREVDRFTDVRELQKPLEAQGVELMQRGRRDCDRPGESRAAGSRRQPVLIDQHV